MLNSIKFWSTKYLTISSGISAGINFLSSIIIIKLINFEAYGIWLNLKSMIQFSTILSLGIPNYLFYIDKKNNQRNEINFYSSLLVFPYILLLIPVFLIIYNDHLNYLLPILFFATGLYLSGSTSLSLRADKNGKVILFSNIFESLAGLILMCFLYFNPSIVFFIYLQGVRFFIKFFYQNYHTRSFKLRMKGVSIYAFLKIIRISFPIHLRNWIQNISQYGDKLILPLIFGFTLLGEIGMGSNFALPIIILISSTSIILVPIVIENDDLTFIRKEFKNKINQVIKLSLICSFIVPFSYLLFDKEVLSFFLIGYWLTISINLFQLISIWFYKKNDSNKSSLYLFSFLLLVYFIIFITSMLFDSYTSLIISIIINLALIYLFLRIKLDLKINLINGSILIILLEFILDWLFNPVIQILINILLLVVYVYFYEKVFLTKILKIK